MTSIETKHGPYPHYREASETTHFFPLYGSIVDLCQPPLTSAAKLLYFSRREVLRLAVRPGMPTNRAHANQLGINGGQTQADLMEVNDHKGAKFLPAADWDWKDKLTDDELELVYEGVKSAALKAPSACWDDDWERSRWCWSPWSQPALKATPYTFGCMNGLFQGRILVCRDTSSYPRSGVLIRDRRFPRR